MAMGVLGLWFVFATVGVSYGEAVEHEVFNWPNVLGEGAWLFDQGSTHGYAVSSSDELQGPAPDWDLSDKGKPTWQFGVSAADSKSVCTVTLHSRNWTAYPGGLRSAATKEGLTFSATFIHLSRSIGLVRLAVWSERETSMTSARFSATLTNRATQLRPVDMSNTTVAFEMPPNLEESCLNGTDFHSGEAATAQRVFPSNEALLWSLLRDEKPPKSGPSDPPWSVRSSDISLSAEGEVATYMLISSVANWEASIYRLLANDVFELENLYRQNLARWDAYLNKALESIPEDSLDPIPLRDRRWVAVKSVLTLMNNWRFVPHLPDGVLPSYTGYRQGFWSWDTYKAAVGMALFFPEMAKEQLRLIVSAQDPTTGHIPDKVDRCGVGGGCSGKPPLLSWAVWEVYKQTQDLEFLREMRPAIESFHAFWYAHRDVTGEGLCSWTEGMESGMDDAVRFMPEYTTSMSNATTGVTTLNAWAVDLNAYLYQEKLILADIANSLGDNKAASQWLKEAQFLLPKLQQIFFVPGADGTGFFQDSYFNDSSLDVQGCEGYAALFCRIATRKQALAMTATLSDPSRFLLPFSLPTVSKKNRFYDGRGFWKGSAWLDQTWFAYEGLKYYGRLPGGQPSAKLAAEIRKRIFEVGQGLKDKDSTPYNEHYDPATSDPLGATHFSWTATHALRWAIDWPPTPAPPSEPIVV